MKNLSIAAIITTSALLIFAPSFAATNLEELIKDREMLNYDKALYLNKALNLDAVYYFKLRDTYDTELKKKIYYKTEEGSQKLAEVKKIREEALKSGYYVKIPAAKDRYETKLSDYSVKYKGFLLETSRGQDLAPLLNFVPSLIENVQFKMLPIKYKESENWNGGPNYYEEKMPVFVKEEQAVQIESNKKDFDIILTFNIKGPVDFGDIEAACPVQLYFVNRLSGEVYAEKTYPCGKSANKSTAKKSKKKK